MQGLERIDRISDILPPKNSLSLKPSSSRTCEHGNNSQHRLTYLGMSDSEYESYAVQISVIERQQQLCTGCTGISGCRQANPGMVPVVQVTNAGKFNCALKQCDKLRQKQAEDHLARLFQYARIPKRYADASWDSYQITSDNERAVRAAKWVITEPQKGLYIYGGRGTGKTMLASIIAKEKAAAGKTVLFESVSDLLSELRRSYQENKTAEIVATAQKVPCLILDDLGAERMNEWVGEVLYSLINYRYNEELQTILTSNYKLDDLQHKMVTISKSGDRDTCQGQRITSRIADLCYAVEITGQDRRGR